MKDRNNNNGYRWFLLLFLAIFFTVFGIKATGILSVAFFLASVAFLVAGIGSLEKTLEEMAVEEESEEAWEKEAKDEEELRKEDEMFRANEEQRIRNEIAELTKLYREGKILKRKYAREMNDLKGEFEELKAGVEMHRPMKKCRRIAKVYNRAVPKPGR